MDNLKGRSLGMLRGLTCGFIGCCLDSCGGYAGM